MNVIDKLMALQTDSLEKIEKAHVNFKKSPKERITLGYVQGRLEVLENYYREFKSVHEKLVTSVTKEEKGKLSYFTEDVYDMFEERFYTYKGELKTVLQKLGTETRCGQGQEVASGKPHASASAISLPHITIPVFSGNYTEWQSFHDLFTTLIHKNSSLDDVQKMHYLKVNLKGDAEVLLRQFSVTGENYAQAWAILKRRYDNKRYIANCLFKKFFGQKAIVQESAAALKQLLDTSVECLNALKNLGLPTHEWDAIVIYIVVSKLDTGTHKHWEELISGDESNNFPGLEKLKSFLETRFRTLEMVEPVNKSYKPANLKTFHITATNVSGDTQCAFCKEKHYIYNCKQFAKQPVEERYNFVQNNNLCFNCLIPNHTVWRCKQKTSCQVCKRRHHSLLHRDTNLIEGKQENEEHLDATKEDSMVVAHVRPSGEKTGQNVLLATALVNVTSEYGQPQVCRALVDQGSEVSFVTARVVELLRLKKTAMSGAVSGIGEGNNVCINNKVELQISSRHETDFSLRVNAYVLDSLTRSLPAREISCKIWPQLDNMNLADPTFNMPGRIDILLGADVFGKIIDSGFMRGPGDVVAQYTHLGWILSGNTNTTSSSSHRVTSFHVTRQVEKEENHLRKRREAEMECYTNKITWPREEVLCKEDYKHTQISDNAEEYKTNSSLWQDVEETVKSCGRTNQEAIARFKYKEDINKLLQKENTKNTNEVLDLENVEKAETNDQDETVSYLLRKLVRDGGGTSICDVFDTLAMGWNDVFINNTMIIVSKLQQRLCSVLINRRAHKTSGIEVVAKTRTTDKYTGLNPIAWKDKPPETLPNDKVITLTSATATTSEISLDTTCNMVNDKPNPYSHAACVVKINLHMVDLITGHEELSEIKKRSHDIDSLSRAGGLGRQQWVSDSEEMLEFLQEDATCEKPENKIKTKLEKVTKNNGNMKKRKVFHLPESRTHVRVTTKFKMSGVQVTSLFVPCHESQDKVKMLNRSLCSLGSDDEPQSEDVEESMRYQEKWYEPWTKEILGRTRKIFADSNVIIYVEVMNEDVIVHVTILAVETKMAPLEPLTKSKLELYTTVLEAMLLRRLYELLNISVAKIYPLTRMYNGKRRSGQSADIPKPFLHKCKVKSRDWSRQGPVVYWPCIVES